jgi:hypothetical protein
MLNHSVLMNNYLNEISSRVEFSKTPNPYQKDFEIIHSKKTLVKTLKEMLKKYHLKVSGDKSLLIQRMDQYFRLSVYAIKIQRLVQKRLSKKIDAIKKIQKLIRCYIYKTIVSLRGPAYLKRKLCTNENDFLTGDTMQEVEWNQFFSFTDNEGFVFGFDILAICALINKCERGKDVLNPYNRKPIAGEVIQKLWRLVKLCNMTKMYVTTNIRKPSAQPKSIQSRVTDIFMCFDSLGYTNPNWFFELNNHMLCRFLRELSDIFFYRSQCSVEMRRQICPPSGDPFRNFTQILYGEPNMYNMDMLRNVVVTIMENMIFRALNDDAKMMGCSYVLCSFTLVNNNAAIALPWLYHSVA